MTLFTTAQSIQLTSILAHKNITQGTYLAMKKDKFIIWYDHEALLGLLDRMEEACNNQFPSTSNRNWTSAVTTSELSNTIIQYVDTISANIKNPPCRIVEGTVDGVSYETYVRTFTPNIPRTVGRSWYPTLHFHMKLYGRFEPNGYHKLSQTHPVYGEHIGWTTGIVVIN
jgi:hypothetical protein